MAVHHADRTHAKGALLDGELHGHEGGRMAQPIGAIHHRGRREIAHDARLARDAAKLAFAQQILIGHDHGDVAVHAGQAGLDHDGRPGQMRRLPQARRMARIWARMEVWVACSMAQSTVAPVARTMGTHFSISAAMKARVRVGVDVLGDGVAQGQDALLHRACGQLRGDLLLEEFEGGVDGARPRRSGRRLEAGEARFGGGRHIGRHGRARGRR